jgi:hypothetical protein
MLQLEEILTKYDFPKRTSQPTITLEELESNLMFPLPDDHKYFLSNYIEHECFIGPEYVWLWDIGNLLGSNKGYQAQKFLVNNIIGIGNNGGGDCIAMELISP